ncbi:sensor domain-containing diguanylate cyclase [Candidatus Xianfuyuplasma coldseepsis]|uniref:Diguanylate cyclase n=1 Tax=Candidatus Xianfuyuplasma coldseepsis TaxID=2782163 RepID=A0A7L7KQ60_9MOLU|nr:GGDEF domain-containing protein [Xianfuyuplasma coldseepsis]QMS84715.1 diguanylate cyclase [Xianfuyuplasma coldseepsis]
MDFIIMSILLIVAFLSFIPVLRMNHVKEEQKYQCLKYLVNTAFVWTIVILLQRLVSNMTIAYYLHMTGYPIKFALAALMVCTIFNYIEKHMPKWLIGFLVLLFIVEVVVSFTNASTQVFLQQVPAMVNNLEDLYGAENGFLFTYHLVFIYGLLLWAVGYLFYFLYNHREIRHYRSISRTMAISVIVVLGFNLTQLLFIHITVDLTYLSLIIVAFSLYQVIFNKDMVYNLKVSGRGEILANMRELYILTDDQHHVVDISPLLTDKYHLDKDAFLGKPYSMLEDALKKEIRIYRDYDMEDIEYSARDHYHLREKRFKLEGFKEYGHMYLLYDETQVFHLLRELNRLSNYDHMTGLNNRNFIEQKLEMIGTDTHLGVVSLDLNGLKANNDYLGHERGDYLLKSLATKMREVMASVSPRYMGRIGGDEFLIIVPKTTVSVLDDIKSRLLSICQDDDIEKAISVSIGTAYSKESISIYSLIQQADQEMYRMKQQTSALYSQKIVEFAKKSGKYIR